MEKKNLLYSILAFAIALALYCTVFLVIPFPKSASSWVSFGFTLLAICLCGVVFSYAFCGKKLKSKLYGFPIFKVGLIYAATQIIVGIIVCVIAAIVNVPVWIPVILYVIILGLGALGFIATDSAKNMIENIDSEAITSTETFANLHMKMEGIIDICADEEIRKILKKLAEKIRYSDPVSCPETQDTENALIADIEELRALISARNFTEATSLADKFGIRLEERNRVCKIYKNRRN